MWVKASCTEDLQKNRSIHINHPTQLVIMFAKWTDPYDIDNYYGGMNDLMKDVESSPSSSMYQQMPQKQMVISKPEQPTGVIINTVPNTESKKNTFDVKPESIFLDGHPVGKQPEYNIFQSGPPTQVDEKKENFTDMSGAFTALNNWTYIILFIIIVFLVVLWIQNRTQLSNANLTIKMLLAFYNSKNTN